MENMAHKYVTVAYSLYTDNEKGVHELIERAPEEHPYQFITGLGVTLDAFEKHIDEVAEGEAFDFVLTQDEAYGPYDESHVVELPKNVFRVNGHFDNQMVYPGAELPLVNADGNRFVGLVVEVKEEVVVIDLNERLAGKDLHFVGKVVTKRDATNAEIEGTLRMLSGEGGCGCGCDDCGGGCGDHEEGCGCGHHHDHEEGCGCGHHHDHEEGCGCGRHHDHEEGCGCGHHHE
ncbi:peptidylprolyl isomerase [Prevotellamassilia timonensis]|uniref:FKBP-type peptidyl-prolyl cis-trans isomerase n=1 Tax=Prevotellamassilia timonensis TaxID=1852370 RepID=UPI001F3AE748|nr:peptidylprolyl isomerase [Prevotellamassilia timonensis]